MAAILFLVVALGLLVAGRAQALAADDGSTLRFRVWQLGLGGLMLLVFVAHFTLGTPLPVPPGVVKGIGLLAVIAVLGLGTLRSRRPRDIEDF
jgi:4-amino-4-deoxy-L-arabinose transferase-like glycosyltransferase